MFSSTSISDSGNMMDIDQYSIDRSDLEYLFSMTQREETLMVYDCQVNGHDGVAMTDSGATRVFLKKTYAEDSNIQFDKSQARDVQLPNGSTMRIVGECNCDMMMSGWKRPVHGIIVDLQAEFDVVLGLNWLQEVEPTPEWKTLNWYVQTTEGIVCLKHRNQVDPEPHRPKLTALQIDTKEDFEWITEKDAKKALRKGARCMLHYARAYTNDSNGRPRLNSIGDLGDLGDLDDPKLQQLLEEYQDIFREELPKELPPERGVVHTIDTGDEKPVNRNAYPLSAQQLREQTKQVESLLERGLIRESSSPWGAPVLFVPKKLPGEWRMCIDYRMLNAKTLRNAYPIPRIQECIDRLGKASNLSSMDLLSGYWQTRVASADVPKTAFNTRHGKYEFLVMPFGLTNAPATFQTLMNSVLRKYIDKFVLVYLDDILIYSNSDEEHREHLRLVFEALREANLYARPLKCTFNKPSVEFCGHIVGQGVVKVLDAKIRAVREWPRPKTVHEVRQFYGLCNYYRRFIRGFSAIVAPLSDLFKAVERKNQPVNWTTACQLAFDRLKQALTSAPVLQQVDENKLCTIETDASDYAVGAALYQEGDDGKLHPVAFDGRKLRGAELRYPTHEKELLAIKNALIAWRMYCDNGKVITIITDHDSLKYMNTMQNPSKRLARWVDEFQGYKLNIQYRPGDQNIVPDALSRRPDYLNSPTWGREEDPKPFYLNAITMREQPEEYVPHVQRFLEENKLPDDEQMRELVVKHAQEFVLVNHETDKKGKLLYRKIREGVMAPYVEFGFRGDLMQSIHSQYGHLSYPALQNVFVT
jgi:hypothetical protein